MRNVDDYAEFCLIPVVFEHLPAKQIGLSDEQLRKSVWNGLKTTVTNPQQNVPRNSAYGALSHTQTSLLTRQYTQSTTLKPDTNQNKSATNTGFLPETVSWDDLIEEINKTDFSNVLKPADMVSPHTANGETIANVSRENIIDTLTSLKRTTVTAEIKEISENFTSGLAIFKPEETPYSFKIFFEFNLRNTGLSYRDICDNYCIKGNLAFRDKKMKRYVNENNSKIFLTYEEQTKPNGVIYLYKASISLENKHLPPNKQDLYNLWASDKYEPIYHYLSKKSK